MTFWLRACPKCGGDLKLQPDVTGAYVQCLQCGLELNTVEQRLLLRLDHVPADQPVVADPVAVGPPHHQVA